MEQVEHWESASSWAFPTRVCMWDGHITRPTFSLSKLNINTIKMTLFPC